MANSFTDALKSFIGIKKTMRRSERSFLVYPKTAQKPKVLGIKKEERKKEHNIKRNSKKKIKEHKEETEKQKKKRLKKERLENLEKAREKRMKILEKEHKKEEKFKEKRLKNLEKARFERNRILEKEHKKEEKEKKKEEKFNEIRLENLKKGREKRMRIIGKEKRKEENLNKVRLKNLEFAREERSKNLEEKKEKEEKMNKKRLKNLEKARKERIKHIKEEKKREKFKELVLKDEQLEIKEEKEKEDAEQRNNKESTLSMPMHKRYNNGLVEEKFVSYEESVPRLLNYAKFAEIIKHEKKIILKPNLTLAKGFPTTTDPHFIEEIIKYIKKHNQKAEIIIAEGSGGCETKECFKKLGYEILAEKYKVALVDLNEAETIKKHNQKFKKYSFIEYPKVLLDGFLISLPVLKGHKEAKVTISLKNMLGCFPARHYGGNWKVGMHKWPIEYSIHDILVCRMPNYAICDASIAQLEHEINGYPKEMNLLIAGDPLEVDKKGALLLGYDWKRVPHLVLADELVHNA